MSLKFATIPSKRLAQSITSISTTFYINNIIGFNTTDSLDVVPADLGTQMFCVFRNDTGTKIEIMEIYPTTISTGPITIVRRGLSYYGDMTTEVSENKLDWSANETIVNLGTDAPQIFEWLKEYIDNASIAGAVPASESAAGILVRGSQAEVDARTPTKTILGVPYDLFARLDTLRATKYHDYIADAGVNDSYAITVVPAITAYTAGQEFTFKANTTNTGTCSLNVCALGAKTIVKNKDEVLEDGDIEAGQIVTVVYDGTNMQMKSSNNYPSNMQVFTTEATALGGGTSRFDITNPAGTTFRYTYDGTGTDPGITSATVPVGSMIEVITNSMVDGNTGIFIVTGSGTNYFEVSNPEGVSENDRTLNRGRLYVSTQTWTKPIGAKFVKVICIGAGGGGGCGNTRAAGLERNGGSGGGGGAYAEKTFRASDLGATVPILVGTAGAGSISSAIDAVIGGASSFNLLINAFGGGCGINNTIDVSGGSGGGTAKNGIQGDNNAVAGGAPNASTGVGVSGGGAGALTNAGQYAEYGGASGGSNDGTGGGGNTSTGGSSLYGGAGGGGGSGVTAANPGTAAAGKAGGRHGTIRAGYGGTAGGAGAGAGGAGTSRSGYGCGDGGGGGGGSNSTTAGAGGVGGSPGGGGGGGGGGTNNSGGLGGAGGNGGRGEVRVMTW